MRSIIYSLLLLFFFNSCKEKIKPEALQNIEGFWEIQQVENQYGKTKEFKINEVIDYFVYSNLKGKRYKVIPMYDESIQQNALSESFKVIDSNGVFYFKYSNMGTSWSEELLSLSDEELVLKNKEGNKYTYKKRMDLKDTSWRKD